MPTDWPAPSDAAAADRLVERFAALGRAEARFAGEPAGGAMLRCLGGNSPFLADLAVSEASALRLFARSGPAVPVGRAMARHRRLPAGRRRARGSPPRCVRASAWSPWSPHWPTSAGCGTSSRVTAALSDLAEAALHAAVAHLLRAAHEAGELRLPHPEEPERASGFIVLGMGKLGARELNYSSDIDLILLHDPIRGSITAILPAPSTPAWRAVWCP